MFPFCQKQSPVLQNCEIQYNWFPNTVFIRDRIDPNRGVEILDLGVGYIHPSILILIKNDCFYMSYLLHMIKVSKIKVI